METEAIDVASPLSSTVPARMAEAAIRSANGCVCTCCSLSLRIDVQSAASRQWNIRHANPASVPYRSLRHVSYLTEAVFYTLCMVIVITLAARHAGATPLHGDVDHLWLRDGTATWPLDVALYEARERRIMPLWQIRVTVEDTPGRLAAVAGGLGQLNINLLTVQVHPTADGAVDELIADVPADVSVAEISAAIRDGGGTDVQIRPAQILTTADGPTQAITLATRLVHDLGDLPWTLIDLLGDCTVSWLPDDLDVDTLEGTTMQLRDPESGRLVISRPAMPFTPTELARARALIKSRRPPRSSAGRGGRHSRGAARRRPGDAAPSTS